MTRPSSTPKPQRTNQPTPSKQTLRVRTRRDNLRSALGAVCVRCGATEALQFDCIVSTGPEHLVMSWKARLAFYERQAMRGNVQLLCRACHVKKTMLDIAKREFWNHRISCPCCRQVFRFSDVVSTGGDFL